MSNDDFSDQQEIDTPKIETPETDTPEEDRISNKVQKTLNLIESGKPTEQEFVNLWNNVKKYVGMTEYERELVLDKLEVIIRTQFPKRAKKLWGPREQDVVEILTKLLSKVSSKYPLEENCVGQGVKIGGAMISGEKYVAAYFSYKSKEKWHVVFEIQQNSAEEAFYIIVKKYLGGEENPDGKIYEEYSIKDIDTALARYCEHLEFILEQSRNAAV